MCKDPFVSDFGPMATQTSKPHSSAVGCDFLGSYEGAAGMRGNKVPKYGKGVTPSGVAHYPKILRISDTPLPSASPSSRPDEGGVQGTGTCTP
jgi:hypothetical protein